MARPAQPHAQGSAIAGVSVTQRPGELITIDISALTADSGPVRVIAHPHQTVMTQAPGRKAPPQPRKIGEKLEEHWVIAGTSPETGKVFSVQIAPGNEEHKNWYRSHVHASGQAQAGRLPRPSEMSVVFNNLVVLKGGAGLNSGNSLDQSFCWTDFAAVTDPDMIQTVSLKTGEVGWSHKTKPNARALPVRDEPDIILAQG